MQIPRVIGRDMVKAVCVSPNKADRDAHPQWVINLTDVMGATVRAWDSGTWDVSVNGGRVASGQAASAAEAGDACTKWLRDTVATAIMGPSAAPNVYTDAVSTKSRRAR